MSYENPREFVESFVNVFCTDYSYQNPLYGEAALHVILGRCLINQRIKKRGSLVSPRISIFYLQAPSSGKSSGYAMIHEVLESLGISIKSPDETTDAALLGTIESSIDEHGNEQWEEQSGILEETEVFHFDEASVLINPKRYQENMMTYLQKALNPIGSEQNKITKKLAHGNEITVKPNCSLLLTSYMPEGLEETVLNTGFLQRVITIPRNLTIENRIEQTQADINALGEGRMETDLEDLINELKSIRNYYRERKEFTWDSAQPTLRKYSQDMYDQVRDMPPSVRGVLEGFVPRMMEQMYRIAMHYTCMRRDTNVLPQDVRNASHLVRISLRMIIHWLEENPELRDGSDKAPNEGERLRKFKEVVSNKEPVRGEYYGVSQVMDDLKIVWGLSETSIYRWINTFEEKDWIDVKTKDGLKYFAVLA